LKIEESIETSVTPEPSVPIEKDSVVNLFALGKKFCSNKVSSPPSPNLQLTTQTSEQPLMSFTQVVPKASTSKEYKEAKSANIKVIIRFRPFNETEKDLFKEGIGFQSCEFPDEHSVVMKNKEGYKFDFTFDKIFQPTCSQADIYEYVGKVTSDDVLNGYNGTIFTYGQSGSGKTFTMYGSDINDPENKGLIPRIVYVII